MLNNTFNNSNIYKTLLESVRLEVKMIGTDKTFGIIGFNYVEPINTICSQFSFSVPATPEYYIPTVEGTEVKVYADGSYLVGGKYIAFKEEDTTYTYTFIGYGYQLVKSYIIDTGTYDNIDGKVIDFINNVITRNLQHIKTQRLERNFVVKNALKNISDNKVDVYRKSINETIDQNATETIYSIEGGEVDFHQVKTYTLSTFMAQYIRETTITHSINFMIYDPYDFGQTLLSDLVKEKINAENRSETIFEFLNRILKIDNLYLKCLGKLEDLDISPNDNKLYNFKKRDVIQRTAIGEIEQLGKNPEAEADLIGEDLGESKIKEEYVLLLWKPLTDKIRQDRTITVGRADTNLQMSLIREQDTFNRTLYSTDIPTIKYIRNSGETNVLNKPSREMNIEDLYDSYIVKPTSSKASTAVGASSKQIVSLVDPDINDGTVGIIEIDQIIEKDLEKYGTLEINKKKGSAFKISAEVVGFKKGLNINNVNYGTDRSQLKLWGANQFVNLISDEQGINNLFLISEVNMRYDEKSGGITTLTLVHPNAYDYIPYSINNTINEFILNKIGKKYNKTRYNIPEVFWKEVRKNLINKEIGDKYGSHLQSSN